MTKISFFLNFVFLAQNFSKPGHKFMEFLPLLFILLSNKITMYQYISGYPLKTSAPHHIPIGKDAFI